MAECRVANPFDCYNLPLQEWTADGLRWLVDNYRPFFQAMKAPIEQILQSFNAFFATASPLLILIFVGLTAWQIGGRKVAVSSLLALIFCGLIGVWTQTMLTVSIVLTSLVLALVIGIPLGIWAAKSDRAYKIMRPMLDGMQTIPAFVYLVPVVMLFGIGNVSGVIVTIIFAIAPVIRLTNLGIRQVPTDVLEAMRAFGCNEWQLLQKAQIPLALPSIMAGINQTLMMSLSMVVIASMIAVGGLGAMVLQGIGRLDVGLATVGGLGIVMLAIILDRLTQSFHRAKSRSGDFFNRGPIGLVRQVLRSFSKKPDVPAES